NFSGMLGHFAELTDLQRWRFMRHILQERPVPPTQDTFWRCRRFENFVWHPNCAWHSVRDSGGVARVKTEPAPSPSTSSSLPRGSRRTFRRAGSLPQSFTTLRFGATGLRLRRARRAICWQDIPTSAQHSSLWNESPEPLLSSAGCTISHLEPCRVSG